MSYGNFDLNPFNVMSGWGKPPTPNSLLPHGRAISGEPSGLVNTTQPHGLFNNFFGSADNDWSGWGQPAVQMGSGLLNSYMGMKNYGLGKRMLAENQRQFDLNYGNQRQLVNSRLEDRQRARVAANPGAYQSVGDYMNQNRIV